MRVWLVHVGEPLPIDAGNERQLRMSLFARMLADRGHDVVWWTSTFDHTHKRQRAQVDSEIRLEGTLTLRLLYARSYSVNISLDRLINHYQIARAFERLAAHPAEPAPDVIFATMPTVELAAAAARFGSRRNIPVVVDVRDLHPDIYLSLVPPAARPMARLALTPLYRELRTSVTLATGLIAIAPSFLDWALRHAGRKVTNRDAVFPLAYPELPASDEALSAAAVDMEASGVRTDRRIIWYVGTYNRWIDLGTPILAARILAERQRDDVQFVFSGSGDFEPEWRRLAGSLPNVVFTGWVDIPRIVYMRSIAWAGLAPYRPGFLTVGNKLFEYMAGGLPVLLSIGGDARRVIEEHRCGLPYEGGDPASLVKAIDEMRSDGIRDEMASNSLQAYRNHYAAEKVYGDMAEFVLDFAARNGDARN